MKKNLILFINYLFDFFNSLDGLTHWIIQRVSAVIIFFLALTSLFSHNLYTLALFLLLVVSHIFVGIQTLIDDYIHDATYSLVIFTSLRLIAIFFLKTIDVLFLC